VQPTYGTFFICCHISKDVQQIKNPTMFSFLLRSNKKLFARKGRRGRKRGRRRKRGRA
jgi:hypothetical protein